MVVESLEEGSGSLCPGGNKAHKTRARVGVDGVSLGGCF